LADAHLAAKRPAKAAAVYRRALKHLPEDLDALRFLVGHGLSDDEPLEALECARRARRLKPMDPEIVGLLWSAHLASARYFARAGRWEEGRAAFASADALCPQKRDELFVLVRRGTFEYKAGCVEAGRQWVEQALQSSPHPAAVWMAMAIEAIRYDLPQSDAWAYEKRWLDALRQRCNGQAAGTMCEFMTSQLKTQKAYKGRAEHVKSLLKYVRRCSRVPPASFPALLPDSMTDVEDPAAQRVSRP
jgi:tetratricopeptide (TPR) repeat protein